MVEKAVKCSIIADALSDLEPETIGKAALSSEEVRTQTQRDLAAKRASTRETERGISERAGTEEKVRDTHIDRAHLHFRACWSLRSRSCCMSRVERCQRHCGASIESGSKR